MGIIMTPEMENQFKRHAQKVFPHESCGLILKGDTYVECENISPIPESRFVVSPSVFVKYKDQIKCFIHSHPNGPDYPSEADMNAQLQCNFPWGIVSTDGVRCATPFYWGNGIEHPPLVGRGFRHGVTDCYSLIRDFFKEEMNESIPDIPRNWEWWMDGKNLYEDFLEFAGFAKHEVGTQPQKGDIAFFSIRSLVPNHAGIYLGNNLFLHHLGGSHGCDLSSLSRREPITRWMQHISFWARYSEYI